MAVVDDPHDVKEGAAQQPPCSTSPTQDTMRWPGNQVPPPDRRFCDHERYGKHVVHDRHGGDHSGRRSGVSCDLHGLMARRMRGLTTETKEMAAETRRIADATDLQAKAAEALVTEAQLDREASRSPYLTRNMITSTINTSGTPGNPKGYSEKITLSNVGGDQAVSCNYVSRRSTDNYWCWLRHPGLAASESVHELAASPGDGDPPWNCSNRLRMIRIRRRAYRLRSSVRTCSGTASDFPSPEGVATSRAPVTRLVRHGPYRPSSGQSDRLCSSSMPSMLDALNQRTETIHKLLGRRVGGELDGQATIGVVL